MGKDMILSFFTTNGRETNPEKEYKDEAIKKARELPLTKFSEFLERQGDPDGEEAREKIEATITDFYEKITHSREVCNVSIFGLNLYITGGLSWGNELTTTFDVMNDFSYLPYEVQIAGGLYEPNTTQLFLDTQEDLPESIKQSIKQWEDVRKL